MANDIRIPPVFTTRIPPAIIAVSPQNIFVSPPGLVVEQPTRVS